MQPDPLSPREVKQPELSREQEIEIPQRNSIFAFFAVLILLFLLIAFAGLGFWAYRLNTNLIATQQQFTTLQGEYEKIKGNNEKLKADLVLAEAELESTKQELATAQTDLKTAQNKNKDLQARIDAFFITATNITNAHLSLDADDTIPTDGYSPSDSGFYCYFDLNNAPDSTVVKGVWILVSADGYESNSEIDSAEITGGDNTYYFSLAGSTDAWPVGTYKIDLYVDGSLVETIDFEVQ